MKLLSLYLLIINAVAFIIMLWDKYCAKTGRWRIPEKTLLSVAAIGGSLGCYLAMQTFRHKTKHLHFSLGVPAMLAVHILLLLFIYR